MTIYDAWLDLQDGFVHAGQNDGRPNSRFFPLVISPTSKAGILFSICLDKANAEGNNILLGERMFCFWIITQLHMEGGLGAMVKLLPCDGRSQF